MSMHKEIKNTGIGYNLKLTQHSLRIQMDSELRYLSLTTPQYAVLSQLELNPGISNADLARASFITPQTMHAIVSNLEKRSLIERKNNPNHGRVLSTKLTRTGIELVKKAHSMVKKSEKSMLHGFSKKQVQDLESLLHKCTTNLKNRKLLS